MRSLRRELSTLSTDQLVDRIKTEMAGTDGADAELVSEVLAAYEKEVGGEGVRDGGAEAVGADQQPSPTVDKLRRSMSNLLVQSKIGRILEVETAGEAQQRAFFVSVLECRGLPHLEEVPTPGNFYAN